MTGSVDRQESRALGAALHIGHRRDRAAPDTHVPDAVVWGGLARDVAHPRLVGPPAPAPTGGSPGYETAWEMLHKLRRAMVRPDRASLHTEVEVDEAYIGGQEALASISYRHRPRTRGYRLCLKIPSCLKTNRGCPKTPFGPLPKKSGIGPRSNTARGAKWLGSLRRHPSLHG